MLIIHTADLHLGASPDAGEKWGKNRKQELWDSFERLISVVEMQQADLLLIAGDVFHRPPLLRELREINDRFASLSKTKVVLMAGNHDYIGTNSFYKEFSWAKNVYFFEDEKISAVQFPELKVDVYGLSYHRKEIRERLYDEARPEDNGYYHILLAHGGDEKHIPYTKEKLANDEYITKFALVFESVKSNFKSTKDITVQAKVIEGLEVNSTFKNCVVVGGTYIGVTVEDKDCTPTTVYENKVQVNKTAAKDNQYTGDKAGDKLSNVTLDVYNAETDQKFGTINIQDGFG